MVRKSERLLNLIVLLLETKQPATVETIHRTIPGYGQDQWDSFKRMFERDKEELREMGIPLELSPTDMWETEHGYRIPKDRYYLPYLDLAPDEMAALWLAASLLRMSDPGPARTALMKLSDLPPPEEPRSLSLVSADMGLAAPNLSVTLDALSDRKRLTFRYRSKDGPRNRTAEPFGLTHRKGRWYLVARDTESGQLRSFRLDRVEGSVRMTHPSKAGPEFEVPEDFRVEDYLERPPFAEADGDVARARVRFDSSLAWWVERSSPWLRLEPDGGGAVATVDVADEAGFVSWLLGFGPGAEVLEPQALRELARRRLEDICG